MNFGGSRLGFWFLNIDRGNRSKKVLVFYDPLTNVNGVTDYYTTGNDVNPPIDIYPTIAAREISLGYEPSLCNSFADLALLNLKIGRAHV